MESDERHISFKAEADRASPHPWWRFNSVPRGIPCKILTGRTRRNLRVRQQTLDLWASGARTDRAWYEVSHFGSHTVPKLFLQQGSASAAANIILQLLLLNSLCSFHTSCFYADPLLYCWSTSKEHYWNRIDFCVINFRYFWLFFIITIISLFSQNLHQKNIIKFSIRKIELMRAKI